MSSTCGVWLAKILAAFFIVSVASSLHLMWSTARFPLSVPSSKAGAEVSPMAEVLWEQSAEHCSQSYHSGISQAGERAAGGALGGQSAGNCSAE